MARMDFKNRTVMAHDFAMVPRADIPRSSFRRPSAHKTTFDAGYLVPVFIDEVLPGDTHSLRMTAFCRMSTPIFPIMDNLQMESFFFFVPMRLVWGHWVNFMGEQANPSDSISFTIPVVNVVGGGYAIGTLQDYFGLGTVGQVTGNWSHNNLPMRAYNLIWNTWFRDENLQNSQNVPVGSDGPDTSTDYVLMRRGKRHDYFTSCLPFTQKGAAVSLPLGSTAPVRGIGVVNPHSATSGPITVIDTTGSQTYGAYMYTSVASNFAVQMQGAVGSTTSGPNVYADLSAATSATINAIRLAFQTQKLLERDARGGTRYTELVRSHFGVVSPDARLQRPEYLGGGRSAVNVGSVPQTSATGVTGGTTPQGSLAAFGTIVHHENGFSQSFTEHGYVIGLVSVQADLTYGQGLRKLWSRSVRSDFYFPVFAMLGEQAVLNQEIYLQGNANDVAVFGYNERWAEYRYFPSLITSVFRVNAAGTLAVWHLSQNFTALPTLASTFIQDTPPVSRVIAAGALGNGQQFIADFYFDLKSARPMPMFSVPGLIDHF